VSANHFSQFRSALIVPSNAHPGRASRERPTASPTESRWHLSAEATNRFSLTSDVRRDCHDIRTVK
jgi:hypothetical protein